MGYGIVNLGAQVLSHGPFAIPQTPPDFPGDSNGPTGSAGAVVTATLPLYLCAPPVCLMTPPIVTGTSGSKWTNLTFSSGQDSGTSGDSGGGTNKDGTLVNAGQAVVDPRKVTGYALDPTHPVGGNKAVVFDSALGFNQSNADELISQIQQGVTKYPATLGKSDQFGQRLTVDMPITGPNGNTVPVRTGWIYDPGSSVPRLTTVYVK